MRTIYLNYIYSVAFSPGFQAPPVAPFPNISSQRKQFSFDMTSTIESTPIPLSQNPHYKPDGRKAYLKAMRKWKFSPLYRIFPYNCLLTP